MSTVQEVLDHYKQGVQERNLDAFLSAYSSDIHIYDCWGAWESKGIESWRTNVNDWFNGLKESEETLIVGFDDVVIEESANLAFVHCAITYAAYKEGSEEKLRQMTNRFTFCMKKVNDSWVITHEHSSLPISMENGRGMFHLR
ncbi:nuclear transport factor 2 family protein [Rossellomorea aquimaris]|uniref:YybH family protein n=1 Tax=Rossellomorea aquimaris TaxID=189382 RepID=UPI001CD2D59B|nr:nuclear transport factor 2 family protein [Rossellomorea aquimaris]MCA1054155.1 nuclear transport factor 2 family protein [Rossellomorea aquimaris]